MMPKHGKQSQKSGKSQMSEEAKVLESALGEQPDTTETKAEAPATQPAPVVAPAPAPAPAPVVDVRAMAMALPDDNPAKKMLLDTLDQVDRINAEKALLEKVKTQDKAWDSFKEKLSKEIIPQYILPALKDLGLEATSKRIVITFPDGKLSDGSAGSKGNGGTRGATEKWGKGILEAEGGLKVTEFASPNAMAKALGLQVTGRSTMVQVFEEPVQAYTPEEREAAGKDDRGVSLFNPVSLPKIYKIKSAIKGQAIVVTKLDKPQS